MSTKYIVRSVFYCITSMTTLSMLSIIRLQSAEIRGEECQPGAMFWMILFATTGGALGMYYVRLVRTSTTGLEVPKCPVVLFISQVALFPLYTPLVSGLLTVFMAFAILIWFYDIDYMDDCRWRRRMLQCFCGKRRPLMPIIRHLLDPFHPHHHKTNHLNPVHRLSVTSSAGT